MKWTKQEIKFLKQFYETKMIMKEINKHINRSLMSIYLKGMYLGLKRPSLKGNNNPAKRLDVRLKMSLNHTDISGNKNPMKKSEVSIKFRGNLNPAKRLEVRKKISKFHKGRKRSKETCQKIGLSKKGFKFSIKSKKLMRLKRLEYLTKNPNKHPNKLICHKKSFPEKLLGSYLKELLINSIPQYMIQGYKKNSHFFIDYYSSKYNVGFECDGTYWHNKTKIYDNKRDNFIFKKYQIKIIRLNSNDIISNKQKCLEVIKNGTY